MKMTFVQDILFKVALGSIGVSSLFLILSGLYYGEWWASFGLVLFMPTLIAAVAYFHPPTVTIEDSIRETTETNSSRVA